MTVAALTPTISYAENGVTLAFAVPFRFNDPAHLVVKRIGADGSVTALAYGSAWSATGGATDAGGTVTLVASVADATLTIERFTPRAQATDYDTNDRFPAESHEAAIDRAMMVAQEQDVARQALAERALLMPDGEAGLLFPDPVTRANQFFGFDMDGAPVLFSSAGQPIDVDALKILFKASGTASLVRSIGTRLDETVSASDYSGATDTDKINAAIAAAAAKGTAARVLLDRDYLVTDLSNPYGVVLEGPGKVLKAITGGNQQLNSYADAPGRLVYGEEYLDRVMQRLKLGASGSSGQIGIELYGDSTVAGGYMSMSTVDLVKRLFHARGIGNIAVTNRGVAGTTVADLDLISHLSPTLDLAIIKYGINDGGNPDGTRLATLQTTLDAKLTAARAAANGGRGNIAIALVGPNATSDTPNGRDERWYEQVHGVYLEAARKHKCAYVDVYGYMRDARGGATVGWDDPYADGRAIHPTDSVGARIWGLVVDAIVPAGWSQWWGTSTIRNVTNTANAPIASATPSQWLTGLDHARATTGNGWPVDGFVMSFRNPDQGVIQFLYPYAANDTRVLVRTANIGADTWNRWTGAPEGLTLQNGWVAYGAPYGSATAYIDHTKTVHVSGVIKSGTVTAGTLLFTLPVGMRPPSNVVRVGAGSAGTVLFAVATNGNVTLLTAGDATLTALDGISFLAQ